MTHTAGAFGGSRLIGRHPRPGMARRELLAGWLFCSPALVLLILFLALPIGMALWVSFSNWSGIGSPLAGDVRSVGLANYKALLTEPGLPQQDLGESIRNNLYFVLLVVPLQTALALLLAVVVSQRRLFARGFFRTAYYFPSVTSSVAISIIFIFLFSGSGVVNSLLGLVGAHGPTWFDDPNGLVHIVVRAIGGGNGPAVLSHHGLLGLSWWDWLAGPSVAMSTLIVLAIWTTSGTFMLIFLPALYNISSEIEEAAMMDGANAWQRFRHVTLPMLQPALFLVLTLGLIGTWQLFDQVYLITQGNPAGTTLTPAYLAYNVSFSDQEWGQGAAIAFILFFIIIFFTLVQRLILRGSDR